MSDYPGGGIPCHAHPVPGSTSVDGLCGTPSAPTPSPTIPTVAVPVNAPPPTALPVTGTDVFGTVVIVVFMIACGLGLMRLRPRREGTT